MDLVGCFSYFILFFLFVYFTYSVFLGACVVPGGSLTISSTCLVTLVTHPYTLRPQREDTPCRDNLKMTENSSRQADSAAICVAVGRPGTTFSLNYLISGWTVVKSTLNEPLLSGEQLSGIALWKYPVALWAQTEQVQGLV